MTIKDLILKELKNGNKMCDDCLSDYTGVTPRQSINQSCRDLSKNSEISRSKRNEFMCDICKKDKIVNFK